MAKVNRHFVETCTVLFQSADADGNGYLDPEEFVAVLKSKTLNLKLSPVDIDEVSAIPVPAIADICRNIGRTRQNSGANDGSVALMTIGTSLSHYLPPSRAVKFMLQVVLQADKDGDGEITLDEFIPIVENLFYRKAAFVRGRLNRNPVAVETTPVATKSEPPPATTTEPATVSKRGWGVRLSRIFVPWLKWPHVGPLLIRMA